MRADSGSYFSAVLVAALFALAFAQTPNLQQTVYIKAPNTANNFRFGFATAISSDGNWMVICSANEGNDATGILLDPIRPPRNGAMVNSGAAYLYQRAPASSTGWKYIAYIKADNAKANNFFCASVAMSADGSVIAIGADGEQSNATGIFTSGADQSAGISFAGAVYLYSLQASNASGISLVQTNYIKAPNVAANYFFGHAVALSGDGTLLAVGSHLEDGGSQGVGGDFNASTQTGSGAVYVYFRNSGGWQYGQYIKASNSAPNINFGKSVSLSANGKTLVVGGFKEGSLGVGINPVNRSKTTPSVVGAVYVFEQGADAKNWTETTFIKASNAADVNSQFGYAVALSADGLTLAVGSNLEVSAGTGIDGNQTQAGTQQYGAVYIFSRPAASSSAWSQTAYIKQSSNRSSVPPNFGTSIALSADGNNLLVGAIVDNGIGTGTNPPEGNVGATNSGAAYWFVRSQGTWQQPPTYVKAHNSQAFWTFGSSCALSGDASIAVISARTEPTNNTGFDGTLVNTAAGGSGAAYAYSFSVSFPSSVPAGSTVTVTGPVVIPPGQTVDIQGTLNIQGTLTVSGQLTVASGASVAVSNNLNIAGNVTVANGGSVTSNATLSIAPGATLTVIVAPPSSTSDSSQNVIVASYGQLIGSFGTVNASYGTNNSASLANAPSICSATPDYGQSSLTVTISFKQSCNNPGGLSTGALVGIIVGAACGAILIGLAVALAIAVASRRHTKKVTERLQQDLKTENSVNMARHVVHDDVSEV